MTAIADRAKNVSPSLTLEITARAKKMKADGLDVVSFGAGEPDFNTPPYICEAAKAALDQGLTKYTPASGTVELRKAIAKKLADDNGLTYEFSQIVVNNGAKHSLYNALQAIVNPGDEVIIPTPYWLTYPELVKLCDGVPVYVHTRAENGFKITPDELKQAIGPKTRALIFNNPNNPTGAVYTPDETRALAEVIEGTDVYVIADEIYEKLIYDDLSVYSIAAYSEKVKDQTIVINGVSKTYSMTGWRIGYTAANSEVAAAVANMQSHTTSNPNTIAQYATLEALTHDEGQTFLTEMCRTFDARRQCMIKRVQAMEGLRFIRPQGAFYMLIDVSALFGCKAGGKVLRSALDVANALLDEYKTAVIPCESFGAPDYIRLSYAVAQTDIEKGLDRLEAFVKSVLP